MNQPLPQQYDISSEQHRAYLYQSGASLKVESPMLVTITPTPSGELHFIQTRVPGESLIIIPGWIAIKIQHQLPPPVQASEPVQQPEEDILEDILW